jgi:diguanylate cyclase (GGDEF)-like protein/PAS domain S-box-containing protein
MKDITQPFIDRVLMEGITNMVFVMRVGEDSEFYYEFLNRAAMEWTGLNQSVLGKCLRSIYPEEKADFLSEHYNRVKANLESLTFEDTYISPLGERYYTETKLTPLLNEMLKCTHIVALVQDITEKKWSEFEIKESRESLNESREQYRSLFHYNSDAIFSFDLKGRIISGNAAVENVTGYLLNELIGSTFYSLVTTESVNPTKENFQLTLSGLAKNFRTAILNKSGRRIELIVEFTPIIIHKEVVGVYGILKDITENVELHKKYEESENRFKIIAENVNDLITLINETREIIYVSPSCKEILGFNHHEYIGKSYLHNVHPDDIEKFEKAFSFSKEHCQPCKVQFRQRHRTKGWIWSELHAAPVYDGHGRFINMVMLARDITLRKEYESRLKYLAYHDSLTELPNRRLFKKHLMAALKENQKAKDGLAVIMMDIDHFKNINDQMGHDIGDEVIKEFGKRIRKNIRESDIVSRLGGDEFVILLRQVGTIENAEAIAENIQKSMLHPWNIKHYTLKVTVSMGIAMAPSQGATVNSMLKNSDKALYSAKSSGRNTYKTINSFG